jgi:hypothetical protein
MLERVRQSLSSLGWVVYIVLVGVTVMGAPDNTGPGVMIGQIFGTVVGMFILVYVLDNAGEWFLAGVRRVQRLVSS